MKDKTVKLFLALFLAASGSVLLSCNGDDGGRDTEVDGDAADIVDLRPEICYAHPNTCNTGGGVIEPYNCCSAPRVCCNLCFPPEHCGSRTECLEECPQTIPCEGNPTRDNLSCYFNPSDFSGTVYCPVHENPNPAFAIACVADCPTGVICPLPEEIYGDTALCCPENWSCDTVPLYNLPVCVSP